MKKKHRIRNLVLLLLVLAAVGYVAYSRLNADPAAGFKTDYARTQDIVTYYTFSGNLEPDSFKIVTATTRGTVKEWKFQEGDFVEKDKEVLIPKGGTRYKAPMDGTISDLYVDEGKDYTIGDQLFRVADYANPVLKIKVDEYDVSALAKGMTVDVKVHATGKTLHGTIKRIAQEATVSGDVAYYEAEITVPQDGSLVMGLTCEVSVLRDKAENATCVPVNAIQYDEDGKPFVYCYDRNNEVVTQSVLLGITNGTYVEIKDGLRSGEAVLIPPSFMAMMMGR